MRSNLKLSGIKQDLVERLQLESRNLYSTDTGKFRAFVAIVKQVKESYGRTSPASTSAYVPTTNSYGGSNLSYEQRVAVAQAQAQQAAAARAYSSGQAFASGSNHPPPPAAATTGGYPQSYPYSNQPAALPRAQFGAGGGGGGAGSGQPGPGSGAIKFRPSPFWKVEKAVGVNTLLAKAGQGDRKQVEMVFMLNEECRSLLSAAKASPTSPQYQLRLFSASENYYDASRPNSHQNQTGVGAPIEFPTTCEIKLNGLAVSANTRGIKNQVGTAPPVDLSKGGGLRLQPGVVNKVEVVYVNTDKRYYMAAYLVEVTSVSQVVARIKKGKYRSKEDVMASIIKQNADPDVVATALGLSLRDPLVGSRIKTPIRATSCEHIGCFDAEVFFMMNEQTPAWKCPICSKVLKVDDITVDGYFDSILSLCPPSIESVTVEPDGTWRSSDDQHGTAPPKGPPKPIVVVAQAQSNKGKGRATETLTLDSDDGSDDGFPLAAIDRKPIISNVAANGNGNANGKRPAPDVIDLTGDSESEDEGQGPPPPKRSASMMQHQNLVALAARRAQQQAQANAEAMDEDMEMERGLPYPAY
ncbi:hypothetical protein P7C70_g4262, partial [Phenoliferia sp. Uapishka_3]